MRLLLLALALSLSVPTPDGSRAGRRRPTPEAAVRRPRAAPVVLAPGERRPGDAEVLRHLGLLEEMEMVELLDLLTDTDVDGLPPGTGP